MIPTMPGDLQPLDQKFAISKPDGRPTDYFIRWAQQRQIDIGGGITEAEARQLIIDYLAAHQLQEGSGIDITPSGDISDSPTITARVQAILDQITTTRGAILFRGAGAWEELDPGTTGEVLTTQGAGADPTWDAASGIPGGGTTGEVLTKLSNADFDADWEPVPHELPTAGTTGQLLAKASGTDYDVDWVDPVEGLTPGGTTGQVLTKLSGADFDADWETPIAPVTAIYMPVVDGSIPPNFIQLPDGNLVYSEVLV
jgi:hypothetical protein